VAYGNPVGSSQTAYRTKLTHDPTGITADFTLTFRTDVASSEVQRDGLFQALLTAIEAISGVTTSEAFKNGGYSQTVTP
jgi:hypothetical protein